jgi:hypothetical protein
MTHSFHLQCFIIIAPILSIGTILWQVDPLQGNDGETNKYTTAVTRQQGNRSNRGKMFFFSRSLLVHLVVSFLSCVIISYSPLSTSVTTWLTKFCVYDLQEVKRKGRGRSNGSKSLFSFCFPKWPLLGPQIISHVSFLLLVFEGCYHAHPSPKISFPFSTLMKTEVNLYQTRRRHISEDNLGENVRSHMNQNILPRNIQLYEKTANKKILILVSFLWKRTS